MSRGERPTIRAEVRPKATAVMIAVVAAHPGVWFAIEDYLSGESGGGSRTADTTIPITITAAIASSTTWSSDAVNARPIQPMPVSANANTNSTATNNSEAISAGL